jgi:transcriptional regulator with XRE-family HTH domain
MPKKKQFKSKALQFTYDRYVGQDPELEASFEEELAGAEIASQIYKLRTRARLSQRQLAAKIGTTASVICRLEDSDYEGHSLSMLRRIGAALGRNVKIVFVTQGAPAGHCLRFPSPRRVKRDSSARPPRSKQTAPLPCLPDSSDTVWRIEAS